MNLQTQSLLAHIQSGAKYDDSDVIVKNILFDIDSEIDVLEQQINTTLGLIEKNMSTSNKLHEFGSVSLPNTTQYNELCGFLSTALFDDFKHDTCRTQLHIEWKEYFHGLYDTVVIPSSTDRTHTHIMFQTIPSYFTNFITEPQEPEQTDRLYEKIQYIRDLFKRLKNENERLVIPDFAEQCQRNLSKQVSLRMNNIALTNEIRAVEKQIETYRYILKWSVK
jgi:hypothetical protein